MRHVPITVWRKGFEHFTVAGAAIDLIGWIATHFAVVIVAVQFEWFFILAGKLAFVAGGYAVILLHKEEHRQQAEIEGIEKEKT